MDYKNLLLERNEGILTVKINNPKSLNALNYEVLKDIESLFDLAELDEKLSVVILTGEGKAFVAGADIGFMKGLDAENAKKFSEYGSKVFRKIETSKKIVIAAINGFALGGGCELAMACDIRVASVKAKFGQPEVGLGLIPGFSGTQRLPRLVGLGKAKEIILTGNIIDVSEAYRIGLVNIVTDAETLKEEAYLLAKKIASNSKYALSYAKEAMNRGIETDIETGMALEVNLSSLCFTHKDYLERINAFIEKKQVHRAF